MDDNKANIDMKRCSGTTCCLKMDDNKANIDMKLLRLPHFKLQSFNVQL
jgi:hypothetical protein